MLTHDSIWQSDMFIFNIRCPHTFSHKVSLNCEFLSFLYTFFSIHASLSQIKTINTPARTQTHICFLFFCTRPVNTHAREHVCVRTSPSARSQVAYQQNQLKSENPESDLKPVETNKLSAIQQSERLVID